MVVKDKKGKPIEGLTARDFVVTEDGVPQEIAFVEYQKLDAPPLGAMELAASDPDGAGACGVPIVAPLTAGRRHT